MNAPARLTEFGFSIGFLALVCCLSPVFALQTPPVAKSPSEPATPSGALPGTLPAGDPLIENLEGADSEKGALAARDLLAQIVQPQSPRRGDYLAYLRKCLSAESIVSRSSGAVASGAVYSTPPAAAERIVAALAYTASSGQPYPAEGAELVLRLVGHGPDSLRKTVRDALEAFTLAERRAGGSQTIAALGALLQADSPPAAAALDEISSVLWRAQGKELLRSLVSAISRHKSNPQVDLGPFLQALRDRLGFGFSTPEEWERWWAENDKTGIEVILEVAHRQLRIRAAEFWRRMYRRLESAGDPEALLASIADIVEQEPGSELRAAAVEALGAFPDWLRSGQAAPNRGGPPLDEARWGATTSRALALLLKFLPVPGQPPQSVPEVRRKALIALRSYAAHLSRSPREEELVLATIQEGFRRAFPELFGGDPAAGNGRGGGWTRADRLELVRTAGILHLQEIRPQIELLLPESSKPGGTDGEFLVETIGALGRILERQLVRESVERLVKVFRAFPEPGDKMHRDVRKACVTALNLPIEDPNLRGLVRTFHIEVLANPDDRVGRVPAIIGLGILAKGGDGDAVDALAELLQGRAQFEPAEVTAAADSLSYLGGRQSIEHLLPYLDAKDKPFSDHVWRKCVGILKGGGPDLLAWTLERIEEEAYRKDQVDLLSMILRLAEEKDLAPLLAPERISTAGSEQFLAYLKCLRSRSHALETAGDEKRAASDLTFLRGVLISDAKVKEAHRSVEEELNGELARLAKKTELKATLARSGPLPDQLPRDLLGLIQASDPAESRWRVMQWIRKQLLIRTPSADSLKLADELLVLLPGEAAQPLWREIDLTMRDRYMKSLESIRDQLKAAGRPGG